MVANILLPTGCSSDSFLPSERLAPSLNILGAFFPGWLFCMIFGLIAMLIIRWLLVLFKVDHALKPRLLFYLSLMVLFSLLFWIFVFRN